VRHFAVFQDVIFDVNGQYHVAVPLYVPKHCENYAELKRDAQTLANLCYALEGQGILSRPVSFMPALLVQRQLKRRGSKFVECFGNVRTPQLKRAGRAVKGLWHESAETERPAFKVYRFRKGAWPEMILHAVMGAAHHLDIGHGRRTAAPIVTMPSRPNGQTRPDHVPEGRHEPHFEAVNGEVHDNAAQAAFGAYAWAAQSELRTPGTGRMAHVNGNGHALDSLQAANGRTHETTRTADQTADDAAAPETDVEAKEIVGRFAFLKKGV
jgi:hypothetical protein